MSSNSIVIQKFISLGKLNPNCTNWSEADLQGLKEVAPYSNYNGEWRDFWGEATKDLTVEGLTYLIKGFTAAENYYSWCGGSAASTIWLFKILEKKYPKEVEKIANWVLQNRGHNNYLPFGGQTYAQNYQQYLVERQRKARHKIEESNRQNVAKNERDIRRVQTQNAQDDRKSDARNKIIQQLESLPLTSRLEHIASDSKYTVNFYPAIWGHEADIQTLQNLSNNTRVELLKKMKGKQKGPWGLFKKRLVAIDPWLWDVKPIDV